MSHELLALTLSVEEILVWHVPHFVHSIGTRQAQDADYHDALLATVAPLMALKPWTLPPAPTCPVINTIRRWLQASPNTLVGTAIHADIDLLDLEDRFPYLLAYWPEDQRVEATLGLLRELVALFERKSDD